ncbi:MAG: hypothetical protein ACK4WH_03735 [Phycisphaerales bacterium]
MSEQPRHRPRGWFSVFLVLAVVALGVQGLRLSRANLALRAQLEAAERALAMERTRDSLAVGESVGPLTLIDSAGGTMDLRFPAERDVLLLLVSAECPYCDQTVPVWEAILRRTETLERGEVAVVCVQLDARSPERLKPVLSGRPTYLAADQASTWLRRVPISPGALYVDRNGVVRKAWFGVPSESQREELARALLGG